MTKLLIIVVIFFFLLVVDLEVSQLIGVFLVCDHPEPVSEVVLLQILLGEVLEISLGEGDVGGEYQLGLLPVKNDLLAEVLGLAGNLDALMKVFLEVPAVHDAVLDGVSAVDGELDLVLLPKLLYSLALPLQGLFARLGGGLLSLSGYHGAVAQIDLYSERKL